MGKGLYCMKIYLFRKQFKLTSAERDSLRRINIFTVTIYVKHWFECPNAADAPMNDLSFIQKLLTYHQTVDNTVADAAIGKLKNHLWYLSEDLVSLGFFSDTVDVSEKLAMVEALNKPAHLKDFRKAECKNISSFQSVRLSDFITMRSLNLFHALSIDQSFLSHHPSTWDQQEAFIHGKNIVCSLSVINDCAERAVKLATDFSTSLTKNEDQRQLAFQVIQHHRKEARKALKGLYV